MFRLVNITFHANAEYADTTAMLKSQQTSYIYLDHCVGKANVEVIKHYTNKDMRLDTHEGFHFFHAKNRFGYLATDTIRYLKNNPPDILLVEGLIFPLQVLRLKISLGKKVKLLAKHHAEQPFTGVKKWLQKLADIYMDGYFFTSQANAQPWFDAKIIRNRKQVYEMPATLTNFAPIGKQLAREQTGMTGAYNYLWVGRLNANKDPLTVIEAFRALLATGQQVSLHMIYQTEELLPEIKRWLAGDRLLQENIYLHGRVDYSQLRKWYSAADFFVSASYSEGGCAAILEAMACGCIPIVTNIPASVKVIDQGIYGLYFNPGDAADLYDRLLFSTAISIPGFSEKIRKYFLQHYSAAAVADQLMRLCKQILGK